VIKKPASIKNDSIDLLRQQTLGNYLPDLFCGGAIGRGFILFG